MDRIQNILEECFHEISKCINNYNSLTLGNITEHENDSNDQVKKLDIIADQILTKRLSKCKLIRKIGSEESKYLIETQFTEAPYLVCFDPLDGSSNIDINVTVGTIFAIYNYNNNTICNGHDIVMAGYCLYGGCTQMIIAKQEVSMYQLIDSNFKLIQDNLTCPKKGNIYSINESNKYIWRDDKYGKMCDNLINQNYSMRWVGSMVADAHRTLIKGGIFSYPGNNKNKEGKIRLLYEAYPFAYIFNKANGKSSNGSQDILDIDFPNNIHQKTPIILSSDYEFNLFNKL